MTGAIRTNPQNGIDRRLSDAHEESVQVLQRVSIVSQRNISGMHRDVNVIAKQAHQSQKIILQIGGRYPTTSLVIPN
jgi:hypothetical protein